MFGVNNSKNVYKFFFFFTKKKTTLELAKKSKAFSKIEKMCTPGCPT
jgi:hypothetical protein